MEWPADESNPWTTLDSRAVYDNRWINVEERQVLNPAGNPGIYGVVHFKNLALGALAVEADLSIWLVGQYRYPLQAYSWEIPEGGGPLNEPPLASIQRELLEETGLTAQRWEPLLTMHLSNSVSDEKALIWLATELRQQAAQPEETESLQSIRVPFDQALEAVLNGRITDSMSVAGILRLALMVERGWRP